MEIKTLNGLALQDILKDIHTKTHEYAAFLPFLILSLFLAHLFLFLSSFHLHHPYH